MRRHDPAAASLGRLPSIAVSRCVAAVETLAFWGAVVVPLGYLPVLATRGPPEIVATLVVTNVACLIVGHGHRPSFDTEYVERLAQTAIDGEVDR